MQKLGAALVLIKSKLSGMIARSLEDRLSDRLSVLDFGADPTGLTPSGDAFQKAFDVCSGSLAGMLHGYKLHIPGGEYDIDKPLKVDWYGQSGLVDNTTRRLTIEGDGSANTFLNFSGDDSATVLTVDGGLLDPHLRFTMRGVRLQRKTQSRRGWGLYLKNISIAQLDEVDCHWFFHGMVSHDVIQLRVSHCQMGANVIGMYFSKLTWTQPNVIILDHVMFGGNSQIGLQVSNGANVLVQSCSFEGTGGNNALGGDHRAILYAGAPLEGGIGLTVRNSYFENNYCFCDISIENGEVDAVGTHIIEGNSFQRTNPVRYSKYHVNVSSNSSRLDLHYRGNTHRYAGGYVHSTGDQSVVAQTPQVVIHDGGNIWQSNQRPQYAATVARGYSDQVVASVRFDGATILGRHNVATVVKGTGTGEYVVNFTKPLASDDCVPVGCPMGVPGSVAITGVTRNLITLTTYNQVGAASNNIPFSLLVSGTNV